MLGSVGLKFNPAGNVLLSADVLFPLTNDGLEPRGASGVVGLEYSF